MARDRVSATGRCQALHCQPLQPWQPGARCHWQPRAHWHARSHGTRRPKRTIFTSASSFLLRNEQCMLLTRRFRFLIMSMGAAASTQSQAAAAAAATVAPGTLDYSDAALRARLTPHAYAVTREKGTERAWTSELNNVKGAGEFRCVACGEVLFTGDGKVRTKRSSRTARPLAASGRSASEQTVSIPRSCIPRALVALIPTHLLFAV